MPLTSALAEIRAVVRLLPGLAPMPSERPPEQWAEWPVADVYASSGEWRKGTAHTGRTRNWSARHGPQTIVIDLLTVRKDLPDDLAIVEPYLDLLPDRLFQAWRGGALPSIQELVAIRWSVLPGERADDATIGYRFSVEFEAADEVPEEDE